MGESSPGVLQDRIGAAQMDMKDTTDESRRQQEHGDLSGVARVSPDGERRPWTTPVLCDLSTSILHAESGPSGFFDGISFGDSGP